MQKKRRAAYGYYSSSPASSKANSAIKLKRAFFVGKRGGPCTTPIMSFDDGNDDNGLRGFGVEEEPRPSTVMRKECVSARKLAANLWELQEIPVISGGMKKSGRLSGRDGGGKDRSQLLQLPSHLADPPHSPRLQVAPSNGSLRKQIAFSLIQQQGSIDRNGGALQPLSPASCSSSVEVGAHNQAITPTSSLDLKIRPRESGYSLATSTELLKVLNRIWSLEEQHSSSMSLVTALRVELDHARARVQELMQEQKADRHQIDNLIKRIADEKMVWKSKEQDKIRAAVQSVREELEDERKLRRRSESLHRKLAREIAEIKTAFAKALQDMERDRKSRELMEDFCDELTKEILEDNLEADDEKEESASVRKEAASGQQILQLAEIWREERIQMKLAEARFDPDEKNEIIDRLRTELESFLKAKRANNFRNEMQYQKDDRHTDMFRRQSLESMHLNGTVSAPQDAGDEDSADSDLRSLEINRDNADDNNIRSYKWGYASVGSMEKIKGRKSREQKISFQEDSKGDKSGEQQISIEDHLGSARSWHRNKTHLLEKFKGSQVDIMRLAEGGRAKANKQDLINRSSQIEGKHAQEGMNSKKNLGNDTQDQGKMSKHGSNNLARTESVQSECSVVKQDPDNMTDFYPSQTSWRFQSVGSGIDHLLDTGLAPMHGLASPTRQWSHHHASPDSERFKNSFDRSKGIRENSLKAKLLEARLEGQQARLRSSKGL
ncbi:hypothetical protein SUGI_0944970 [Cryptomeria japonica]|uniref:uncharacterized protein At5g41620 n=1 Tax=Cryptomeria japonica TaxID=3369 RepID=UPI0024146CD3|nr:uncharacterized protein At5g41620 [Cryptomeria japonica]GLJ44892.1 hypothetical protein SUGI_0944970 [Cryptomeria japonica]